MKNLIYKFIDIIILVALIILIPQLTVPTNVILGLRLAMIIILALETISFFGKLVFEMIERNWLKNIVTGIFSTAISLLLLEAVFMFIPTSHWAGFNLATNLWMNKYWHPINTFGYRDIEPSNDNNKTNIFFIGDSFTAGHGLKQTKDRFSDIVKENFLKRDKNIQVINLGKNGFDTKAEYDSMIHFVESSHLKPKFLVLQYFGNDIDSVAIKKGLKFEVIKPYMEMNRIVRFMIKGSYILNYIYWLFPKQDARLYVKVLENAYSEPSVFKDHIKDVQSFIDYSDSKGIPLLVVIFPFMQDIYLSRKMYVDKLKLFFEYHNVDYIDVSKLSEHLPLARRIINKNDGHASAEVNRLVAEKIYKYLAMKTLHGVTKNEVPKKLAKL